MSISVDDLVASFSSNHISQEALDLQAFKSQMKVLLTNNSQPAGFPPRRNSLAQPCSPPAPRMYVPPTHAHSEDEDRMDEDLVEDMLDAPASPVNAAPAHPYPFPAQHQQQLHRVPPSSPQMPPAQQPMHLYAHSHPHVHQPHHSAEQGLFTSTDPFYLALTQPRYPPPTTTLFAHQRPAFSMPIDGGAVLVDR
ncbi:hypothetical protein K488DRAFT_86597 [Vararia minispora EC-137]|uniref:Uncharacterized protein n=1 Tax=Vararia minispora EC-137 TaxID=1314806 RepID=A0ACB8QIL4_9AGAM|nr:hypothetical protein K488DRAFT_86597 [Vararia minispora EC-137]